MCQRSLPGFGTMSSTSGSPVGFFRFDHVDGALRNVNAPDGEPSIMKANGRGQTDVSKADDPDGHVNI